MEQRPTGMIGAVHFRVAVLTGLADRLLRQRTRRQAVTEPVAFGAEPRPRDLEQIFVHGAVRLVTAVAVLAHRGVLEQERPAFLGVALVTSIIDGGLLEHRL